MRVAVLGSNSFTGADFVDLLLTSGRFEVLGISRSPQQPLRSAADGDRRRFTFRRLDLNAEDADVITALAAFEPAWIVNFAAQGDEAASWAHPQDFFQTNCVALARLIDGLSRCTSLVRFLQISSSSVYGNPPGATITEASPLQPASPYGASKAAADMLLLAYHRSGGFPAQIVRPPNLYGPHQQLFRIIPKTILALRGGGQIELHGGGHAVRAYLHARDASRAMLAILERGRPGDVYNIGPDELCQIREIVALLCELLDKDFAASTRAVDDRRNQPSVTAFGSTKIRRELGWRPEVSLRAGLAEMRDWIERDWSQLTQREAAYTHAR